MLGQHPECYGMPELNLFLADDLRGLWHGAVTHIPMAGDGLLRALSQLHEGEQNEDTILRAREWIAAHLDWSTSMVFEHLQELVGDKIIVEKSPAMTFWPENLRRLIRLFPNANYLHLTRHPRTNAASMITLRETRMGGAQTFMQQRASDPERMWQRSHEMVVEATANMALGQMMRLKGEMLLQNLEVILPQICEWLGVSASESAWNAMMHPENSPYAKPGPKGAPYGADPNFLEAPSIDPARLSRTKESNLDDELSWRPGEFFEHRTKKLAMQFGYN